MNQWIRGKSLNVHTIGTNRSNWGAKFNLHQHRILLHRRRSKYMVFVSTIGAFSTNLCTTMVDTKHKIGGWFYETNNNQPPDPC